MKEIKINAQFRETTGKEAAKRLRNNDLLPAVVYGKGKRSASITVKEVDLIHALHTSAGENAIIELNIKKDSKVEKKMTIIKEIQHHPIKGNMIHVDFSQISLTQNVVVKVPVEVKGEAVGVKRDGGMLEHILWEVEIECLPIKIPEKIEVRIDNLEIGGMVHVKDLKVDEGIKILTNPEEIVLIIEHPKKEEEKAPEEEVESGVKEPEIIGEKERLDKQQEKTEQKQKE